MSLTIEELKKPLIDLEAGRDELQLAAKWAEYLKGCSPVLPSLPTDVQGPSEEHRWADQVKVADATLSAATMKGLQALAGSADSAIIAGFASLLGRYGRSDEVPVGIGKLAAGKKAAQWRPLRVQLLRPVEERGEGEDSAVTPESSIASAASVAQKVKGLLAQDILAPLDAAGLMQLDVAINGEGLRPAACLSMAAAIAFGFVPKHETTQPPIVLSCPRWPPADGRPLKISLHCMKGWFAEKTAVRIVCHLATLLKCMAKDKDAPMCRLDICSDVAGREEAKDVRKWADAYTSSRYDPTAKSQKGGFSCDIPMTALLDESLKATPQAVALIDDGEGGRPYTYKELCAATWNVARELRQYGVKADVLVPLMADRSASMVFGLFGILYAGGAYVPLDLHWPDDRLKGVLEECAPPVVVGAKASMSKLSALSDSVPAICIEDAVAKGPGTRLGADPSKDAKGNHLVYVFFTSGTTGKPKGVMVENAGLVHRIDWLRRSYPLNVGEGVMLKHAYTFGLSEMEIFYPLAASAALVLAPPGGEKDPDYVLRRTCGNFQPDKPWSGGKAEIKLTTHVFVPSMLQMVLERYDELEQEELGRQGLTVAPGGTWWRKCWLRQIITCGEPLSEAVAQKSLGRFLEMNLANLYGPTEGEVTVWACPKGRVLGRVSAGITIEGGKTVLANLREPKMAASLEPAEITFGGPFIARGYLGRPDLTEKAFVPDFTDASKKHRLYLTGDLGRWREGQLELLGRRDFQVKLRGFRIELGEIEAAIRAAGSRNAVCLLRAGAGGAPALVAYFEPGTSGPVSEAAARSSCQRMLPPYMQPQALVPLDKLPRNANGKVDRPKLPDPPKQTSAVAETVTTSLPSTPTEIAVAASWAEVLGLNADKVPADVDFQLLGGSSLLAGRVTALIRKRLNLPALRGTVIYQHPTVQRLAALIDAQLAAAEAAKKLEGASEEQYAIAAVCQPHVTNLCDTRGISILIQCTMVFWANFLHQTQAWSPFWWKAYFIYAKHGKLALFAFLPIAFWGNLCMQAFILVILKWLCVGRQKPGTHELWSRHFFWWSFIRGLTDAIFKEFLPLIADTSLATIYLRLLGAHVGKGVHIGVIEISDPDLLYIEDNVTVGKKVQLRTSCVLRGAVHLNEIHLRERSAVGHMAVLSQGTEVPAGRAVTPLSTMPGWNGPVGSISHVPASKRCDLRFHYHQDLLRIFVGIPCVIGLHTASYWVLVTVLEQLYLFMWDYFHEDTFDYFSIILPWVYMHVLWMSFLLMVVLQKRLIVGRLGPGHQKRTHWNEFRHWLHARAVESHEFDEICDMWINTEVLSMIYRFLGTKVGKRVQMDKFMAVEHDCIEIQDYTVLGSEVLLSCKASSPWMEVDSEDGGLVFEKVVMGRGSNCLDHCVLLPGSTLAEKAVLGTCTLAHRGGYFHPLSVNCGSVRGRSLHLRDHNPAPKLRHLEERAMQQLDNPWVWYRFNLILGSVTMILSPFPELLWVVTYFGVLWLWDPESGGILSLLIITPTMYLVLSLLELLISILLKWTIIGKFKEGDFPFFSNYHIKWMTMMILKTATEGIAESFTGTIFEPWILRANGATIGNNCYLAGLVVEYDLLTVGDNVAIGEGCDTTNHTVENMVIKLSPTRIANGASLLPASFAMPGSVVGEDSVLLEHTQVLKGETVPAGEQWAGMPAARCAPRGKLIKK